MLTVGATANQNETALYEGVTVLTVTGDLTIATCIARSEGVELLHEIPEPPAVDL